MPQPRPKWYQFSLKSLLVLFTVGSVATGLYYVRIGRYQSTVAALREAGATLQFTGPLGESSIIPERVTAVHVPAGVDAAEIIRIARHLPDLERINLDGSKLRDADLTVLALYPALISVSVTSTDITEKGLAHLQKVKTLKTVYLGDTYLSPRAIRALQDANGCHVIAKTLQPLSNKQHTALREIFDGGGHVRYDEEGILRNITWEPLDLQRLSVIAEFPTVHQWNSIPGAPVPNITSAWLEHIGRIRDLQALAFSGPKVSDQGLSHLSELTKVARLEFTAGAATGENVQPWRHMPYLHRLSIDGAELTTLEFLNPASLQSLKWLTLKCPKLTHLSNVDWRSMSNLHRLEIEFPKVSSDALASIVLPESLLDIVFCGMSLGASSFECLKGRADRQSIGVVLRDSRLTRDAWIALNGLSRRNNGLSLQGTLPPEDPVLAEQLTRFDSARIIDVKFNDDHLAALVAMPGLTSISIEQCDFTSADPTILGGLPKIERLTFWNSPMTEGEVAKLREMLPECEITIE